MNEWTPNEIQQLTEMYLDGYRIKDISAKIGRTVMAVDKKISLIGLLRSKRELRRQSRPIEELERIRPFISMMMHRHEFRQGWYQ